jgi:hypothetical protein
MVSASRLKLLPTGIQGRQTKENRAKNLPYGGFFVFW